MDDDTGRTEKEDLSQNYANPAIAARQRELVDRQLVAMRAGNPPPHFAIIEKILAHIKFVDWRAFLSLLDAGCGSAYYAEVIGYYHPGLVDYYGCDYNPGMVALAKERYPYLPVVQADVRNLDNFKDGQFDIVLSGACLMHIREWRKALGEMARVSGNWLILHRTWVYTDDMPTTCEKRDAYGQKAWYYTFNEDELLEQVLATGFERIVGIFPTGETIKHGKVLTYLFKRQA